MKTEKNYQIRVTGKDTENVIARINGKSEKTALSAARKMYPDYDYYLWVRMENDEWAYAYKIKS